MKDERGQSTVELALCLPLIAVVLGAVVQTGLVVADQGRVWHAAREAVRVAAVEDDPKAIEAAAAAGGLAGLDIRTEPLSIYRRQGDPVTVTVGYHPRSTVPLVGELFERLELTARATMRIEQP